MMVKLRPWMSRKSSRIKRASPGLSSTRSMVVVFMRPSAPALQEGVADSEDSAFDGMDFMTS